MPGKSDRDPDTGERIAKAMARAGLCSRREAEAWIVAGRVAVNGAIIASPALNITAADRVVVDGEPLPARERTRLFLYHKPRGLVTTHADPQDRPTIFGALPKTLPRLLSVGRLDMNTEGLLLLTNDGGLARVLELPATGWLRRYRVRAHGQVQPEALAALRDGVTVDGIRYGGIDAQIDRAQGANVWITFAMREGKNREVKNVLGHLGLAVNRLIRVSFGPFQLGTLPEGAVEEVKTRHLREQLGDKVMAQAGADFASPIVEREEPKRPPREAKTPERRPAKDDDRRPQRGDKARNDKPQGKRPWGDKLRSAKPQDDKPRGGKPLDKKRPDNKSRLRRRDEERFGGPELARRERRGRPFRSKGR
jgi:23S rRNA pseudouridine2605 synthase